jgi:hypothetical protein
MVVTRILTKFPLNSILPSSTGIVQIIGEVRAGVVYPARGGSARRPATTFRGIFQIQIFFSKKISLPKTVSFLRRKHQVWKVLISGTT